MRQQFHDHVVRFRASSAIIAKAEEKARAEGMTLSDLIRDALRHAVRDAA